MIFLNECKALGIQVLPPDLNYSHYDFKVVDNAQIAYGLGAIKGVGQNAAILIVEERKKHGEFANLLDFCKRMDLKKVNKRVLEALMKSGGGDCWQIDRAPLMATLPNAVLAAEQYQRDQQCGQIDLFADGRSKGVSSRHGHADLQHEESR